ncbi:hypothetical protein RJ639_033937 [Escallonia herrerae]|uniref:Retrotransposon gag domain-containing protein n=1 Tax=Escallonia herrerae TaxID=1293975 RepID=A0AA89BC32_9ASTE|nr:hypothetical protein RJ639_033937 [Escallonia herrerae]
MRDCSENGGSVATTAGDASGTGISTGRRVNKPTIKARAFALGQDKVQGSPTVVGDFTVFFFTLWGCGMEFEILSLPEGFVEAPFDVLDFGTFDATFLLVLIMILVGFEASSSRFDHYAKEEEFLKLIKNDMSVAQYEAKFTSLSRYAPHLVDTENCKVRRFEKGLKRGIKNRLLALKLLTYAKVVERVEILEMDYEEFLKEQEEQRRKRSRAETSDKNNSGGQKERKVTIQERMQSIQKVAKKQLPSVRRGRKLIEDDVRVATKPSPTTRSAAPPIPQSKSCTADLSLRRRHYSRCGLVKTDQLSGIFSPTSPRFAEKKKEKKSFAEICREEEEKESYQTSFDYNKLQSVTNL